MAALPRPHPRDEFLLHDFPGVFAAGRHWLSISVDEVGERTSDLLGLQGQTPRCVFDEPRDRPGWLLAYGRDV
jgi:hypothetical protein